MMTRLGWAMLLVGMVAVISVRESGAGAANPDDDKVLELMRKAHKGEKSPLALLEAEVKRDRPDWKKVETHSKPISEMAELLKKVQIPYRSSERYRASVESLTTATKDKHLKRTRAAVASLKKSCSACHYGIPK